MKNFHREWISLFLVSLFSAGAWGALDPYALQGEYLGNYGAALSPQSPWGAQIVALDRATKFRIGFSKGGLPGDGWDKTSQKVAFASAIGDKVVFSTEGMTLTVEGTGDSLVVSDNLGGSGILRKVHRVSATASLKPPAGAVVLFNGTGIQEWKDGKVSLDNQLIAGATTLKTFQDFNLHLEFLIPYSTANVLYPDRGNSGVYIQGRFELQIYDSFGWQAPFDTATYGTTYSIDPPRSCGALYQISAPKVNVTYPPGSWQTYDISFVAARFDGTGKLTSAAQATVYQNGVLTQDKVSLTAVTPAAMLPMNSVPGPISLQYHVSDVLYRNIWIEENPKDPLIPTANRSGVRLGSKGALRGKGFKGLRVDGRSMHERAFAPMLYPIWP